MRVIRGNKFAQLTYLPTIFPVNCYLIEEEESLTLVDAALPNNAKAILKAAEQIGKPIANIVLTHAHSDHVGALDAIRETNTDIKVYISVRDSLLLAGDVTLTPDEQGMPPIRGGIPKSIRTKPDVLIKDGDRIGSLLAVSASGHTPGSMAFLDERTGLLLAGDAFHARGGVTVTSHMKWTFPFPALATWSAETSLDTAKRLTAMRPAILATGHGNLIEAPTMVMELAVKSAEQAFNTNKNKRGV
ncbi:MBL fold metallo-hydrolase [Paenibacillus sp. strain BS8-2]